MTKKLSGKALSARTAKARLVLTDIDGVLTAGTIYHFVDTEGSSSSSRASTPRTRSRWRG
ncbi:MAG: hypothetical protein M0D55_13415 [Elusimicrobiota bacterium]|nr:MAG: hypothetical protein M0D55_13415 [Elusimicrobiota bacterium]